MTGVPSRWVCDECNAVVAMTHKGNHRKFKCPKQGFLKKALTQQAREAAVEAERQKAIAEAQPPPPKFFQYIACVCKCGTEIGQVKGQKKRQFVDHEHYETWRREALKQAGGEAVDLVAERKHAEEVAAVAAKDAAITRAAEAVRMVTGEASFRLWAACLGFNAGDVAPVAA